MTPGRERRVAVSLSLAAMVVVAAALGAEEDPAPSPAAARRVTMDYGSTLTCTVGWPAWICQPANGAPSYSISSL